MDFQNFGRAKREEFLSHISDKVKQLCEAPEQITWEVYSQLLLNSYERKLLMTKYDLDCLVRIAKHSLENSSFREMGRYEIAGSYDQFLTGELIPELLFRLISTRPEAEDQQCAGGDELGIG